MSNITTETATPAAAAQSETEIKPKKPVQTSKPAKKAKASKKAKAAAKKERAKPGAERSNKKAEVIALMKRAKGATLADIMELTAWQKHYADVRIMPTCVGNLAGGTGIAAMKSA